MRIFLAALFVALSIRPAAAVSRSAKPISGVNPASGANAALNQPLSPEFALGALAPALTAPTPERAGTSMETAFQTLIGAGNSVERGGLSVEAPSGEAGLPPASNPALSAPGPSASGEQKASPPSPDVRVPALGRLGSAIAAGLTWVWRALPFSVFHPVMPNLYDDSAPAGYSGTSFEDLVTIVRGGGSMKENLTYLSDAAGMPYGYARSRGHRRGSIGVVLQFNWEKVESKLTLGHYQPPVHLGPPGSPPAHLGTFYMAIQPIPLSDLTEGSKKSILTWMTRQHAERPEDPSWKPLLREFETALQYRLE